MLIRSQTLLMATRGCENSSDIFCYICDKFIAKKRRDITEFVRKAHYAYFGIKLDDQNKSWALHKVCNVCIEHLRLWTKDKKNSLFFEIPMIWPNLEIITQTGYTKFPCFLCEWHSRG
jgi:hypothetical protein